jgi:hypothetical protein
MSIVRLVARTEYGEVPFDAVRCDGCGTTSVEVETVGWRRLSPIGATVQTLGEVLPGITDWCSIPCLEQGLKGETLTDVQPQE